MSARPKRVQRFDRRAVMGISFQDFFICFLAIDALVKIVAHNDFKNSFPDVISIKLRFLFFKVDTFCPKIGCFTDGRLLVHDLTN